MTGPVLDEALCEDADVVLYRGHTSEGRTVLVKTLKSSQPTSAEYEALRREAEGARIAGADVSAEPEELTMLNGRPTLVLRDDGGTSLAQFLHAGRQPLEVFFPLALALVHAIAKVHARRLVHGDLRPTDILVLEGNRVELIGFGQAAAEFSTPTAPPRPRSAWPYLSPEQTRRIATPIDHRTDLYSLGVLFFEMLTGQLPFDAEDRLGWFHAHCAVSPPSMSTLVPELPPVLCQLVDKLLSKPPEARYQSADSLRQDLSRCFTSWRDRGVIEAFPLGGSDTPPPLRTSGWVHGRDTEMRVIRLALERVRKERRTEIVLVSGRAGIGKTSLVSPQLRRQAGLNDTPYAFGACQESTSHAPCGALLTALDSLLRATVERSEESPDNLRRRLEERLGSNAPLLEALIPSLARVLGTRSVRRQTPFPEAIERILSALDHFVSALPTTEQPFILALDDLQWADELTLAALVHWVTEPNARPALVVAAYRTDDVDDKHPLLRSISRMKEAGASITELGLNALGSEAVTSWLAEVFRCPRHRIAPLASVVSERTGNVPLLVVRFMETLRDDSVIRYDVEGQRWVWNLEAVSAAPYADDVAQLIADDIRTLSPESRRALSVFAAFGNEADVQTLACIFECGEDEALERLADAFAARLVARTSSKIHFLHDRIQHVAYETLGGERFAVHLQIGRALLGRLSPEDVGERIFDVVRQFELAAELSELPDERTRIAELELLAGQHAQASTQFACGAEYLSQGLGRLTDDDWTQQHALAFDLHLALVRSRFVLGELDTARELAFQLLARAHRGRERSTVRALLAEILLLQGRFDDAISECLKGLQELGVDIPTRPTHESANAAITKVAERVVGDASNDPLQLGVTRDPDTIVICNLVSSLCAPSVSLNWNLFWCATSIAIERSLAYGCTSSSAVAFCNLGLHLTKQGRYEDAYRVGRQAYVFALGEEHAAYRPRAGFVFAAMLSYLALPIRQCIDLLRREVEAATAIGDKIFECLLKMHIAHFCLFTGDPLSDTTESVLEGRRLAKHVGFTLVDEQLESAERLIHRLQDPSATLERSELDARQESSPFGVVRFHYFYYELIARTLLDDREGATRAMRALTPFLSEVAGFLEIPELRFFMALHISTLATANDGDAITEIRAHYAVLVELAAASNANFGARAELIGAELSRLAGDDLAAERGYEAAVRAARATAQLHIEAIASERAARFHRDRHMQTVADAYLVQAHGCYEAWGALRKSQRLTPELPFLAERPSPTSDLEGILKAQQAISSALRLPELHERLLDVALEHAAARRGCLLHVSGRSLRVAATSGELGSEFGEIDALVTPKNVPLSACLTAVRLKKPIVIPDATAEHRYAFDPYFTERRVRSVLCLPIVRKDDVTALLYLENDLVAGAFRTPRLGVLDCIASQAAISLENARLYTLLERENADRRSAETSLAKTKALFDAILDNTPLVTFVKDVEGRHVLINRRFEEVFGLERSQVLGKTDFEFLPRQLASTFHEQDVRILHERCVLDIDDQLTLADGDHYFLTNKFPLLDAHGKPYATCGISTDITNLKQTDEELRRSLSLLEATIDATGDGILVEQLDGKLLYNRRFIQMWDLPEHLFHQNNGSGAVELASEQLSNPAGFRAKLYELYESPEAESFDLIHFKDGKVYERNSQPQRVGGRIVGRVWSFHDVTQRVRDAEERSRLLAEEQRARALAEEAVHVRDEFLSIASHELRTPLAGLSLAVDSLGGHLTEQFDAARVRRAASIAKRQIQRIVALVDMLLDESRLRAGKLVLSLTTLDLRSVVDDVRSVLASELERCGSELVVRAPEPVIGMWDSLRIEQVVTNLLTNAVKFGRGKPITLVLERKGDLARLSVTDRGIGIPKDRCERIFEPFARLVSPRHYGGLGLGLHIAKTIVVAHGGTLSVTSEEEVGSTFTMTLPISSPSSLGASHDENVTTCVAEAPRRIAVPNEETSRRSV